MDYFTSLPLEILDEIAVDEPSYHALITVPRFGRSITVNRRLEFMQQFGHTITEHKGRTEYKKNGILHRLDGPAVISKYCNKWYFRGQLHRTGLPAVEHANGDQYWYTHGVRHNTDGPAVVQKYCTKWYYNGYIHNIHYDQPSVIYSDGTKEWYLHGELHRPILPAIESPTGKCWYYEGKLHRCNGPAVECTNGYTEYWVNGEPIYYG